tara:strand:- start:744 stop:872 length:129 start_codon:yes stop_codon:yes gene_type:complete
MLKPNASALGAMFSFASLMSCISEVAQNIAMPAAWFAELSLV